MLWTEGRVVRGGARGAGKELSACRRSIVVTVAMIVSCRSEPRIIAPRRSES
jgi:hypothetical protein